MTYKVDSVAERIDRIYDLIDDMLLDGEFSEVDNIFQRIIDNKLPWLDENDLIAYLTISVYWRKYLEKYKELSEYVRDWLILNTKYSTHEIESEILIGLK